MLPFCGCLLIFFFLYDLLYALHHHPLYVPHPTNHTTNITNIYRSTYKVRCCTMPTAAVSRVEPVVVKTAHSTWMQNILIYFLEAKKHQAGTNFVRGTVLYVLWVRRRRRRKKRSTTTTNSSTGKQSQTLRVSLHAGSRHCLMRPEWWAHEWFHQVTQHTLCVIMMMNCVMWSAIYAISYGAAQHVV